MMLTDKRGGKKPIPTELVICLVWVVLFWIGIVVFLFSVGR
jgi:hypothetical protein